MKIEKDLKTTIAFSLNRSLARKIKKIAGENDISVSSVIVYLIEKGLGKKTIKGKETKSEI